MMNIEPVTRIDPRFSDPDAVATSWEETQRVLETAELFWVTTVRSDGRPHAVPLVAVWLDGAVHFCTGPEEQKAMNLRANPHTILSTGCNSWESGLDVAVEGDAMRVTDQALLTRLAEAWKRKWNGQWQFEVGEEGFGHKSDKRGVTLVFAVKPTKVLAFAKGKFGYTRHQF